MAIKPEAYHTILNDLAFAEATLVAVSKVRTPAEIMELYNLGHRDFGENYVQELLDKYEKLPKDIRWHFIGHLQSNKVKYIAPFIHLIHGVDRPELLREIQKQAVRNDRIIATLLQVHIAEEETKFGFDKNDLKTFLDKYFSEEGVQYSNIQIAGLMGMATFTSDDEIIRTEFRKLRELFDIYFGNLTDKSSKAQGNYAYPVLSMGMSSDYKIALKEGSNMVRIGSLLFGAKTQV